MSLGVAMLARNSGDVIEKTLAPFAGIADEIAVVIGGESSDDTADKARAMGAFVSQAGGVITGSFLSEAAELIGDDQIPVKYAHLIGYVADFGAARQATFNMLTTDYAVVVDTDDEWTGVEAIPAIVEQGQAQNVSSFRVQYNINSSVIYQPRIFKRSAGKWEHTIHEMFVIPSPVIIGMVSDCQITQPHRPGPKRTDHNILLGELAAIKDPTNTRALIHLAQDHFTLGNTAEAATIIKQYLSYWSGDYDDEYMAALYVLGASQLNEGQYQEAAISALKSIGAKETGSGWSILAEAALQMSNGSGSHGLLELAAMASDKALGCGKPRYGFGVKRELSTTIPSLIKGLALSAMNEPEKALHAVDLGLAIDPAHNELNKLQKKLCGVLQTAP